MLYPTKHIDITYLNSTMIGAALLAGRLVVTFEFKHTGSHVSLEFKGWSPGSNGSVIPLLDATRMYVNVANSWDKVASLYVGRADRNVVNLQRDENADNTRWWACLRVLDIACDRLPVDSDEYRIVVGRNCLRCGAELTEPESIESGYGPHCRSLVSAQYGARHQVKEKASLPSAPAAAPSRPESMVVRVEDPNMVVLRPGESLDELYERMKES